MREEQISGLASQAIDMLFGAETPGQVIEAIAKAKPMYKVLGANARRDLGMQEVACLAIAKAMMGMYPRLCKDVKLNRVKWNSGLVELQYVVMLRGWNSPLYIRPRDPETTAARVFKDPSKFFEVAELEAGKMLLALGREGVKAGDPWGAPMQAEEGWR